MLISPPFLPLAAPNESDEEYLNRAMNSTEGAFPLGQNMIWHGGIHLTAPREGNTHLPVRAIADGTVAYVRQPTATNTDTSHPLNYRNGWTDNGCLILKHETDIGEGAHAKVVFYSIYMHLSAIKSVNIAIDMPIYRKDELGTAGRIYGAPHKIHFEVICSQEQLGHFLGRSTGRLTTTRNGRTDSCWGDIHFYIPPEILFYAARPTNPTSATNESAIVHRHIDAYFVSMNYGKGQCTLTTLDEVGTRLGERQETQDYEYNLYTTASTLYPRSPSAGYELLRFGRTLGPDLLHPHDAAHWRQVAYPASGAHPAGVGWVNLKSPTVTVYSDADFPHWQGWKLIDDDTDGDGRCQSEQVMELLGISEIPVTPQQRTAYSAMINTPENQKKLKRLICKFPSEWERANFFNRYNWLSEGNEPIISAQAQEKLKLHYEALAFWENMDLKDVNSEHWHFPPKEFIRVFRKCGWLSLVEVGGTFPKHMFYTASGNPRTSINTSGQTYTTNRRSAENRVSSHIEDLNKAIRKNLGADRKRISIFLAQVLLETAQWRNIGGSKRLMHEWGFGRYSVLNPATEFYSVFYGRGIMQLTWAKNYKAYGEYRGFRNHVGAYTERISNIPPRLTNVSMHYSAHPDDGGIAFVWAPRFDPDIVAESKYNACDSGGFYWVSKVFSGGMNINRVSDRLYSANNIGLINRLVNGGGNGYYERQAYTAYMLRKLTDSIAETQTIIISPTGKATIHADMQPAE